MQSKLDFYLDRTFDLLLGLSLWGWGVVGWIVDFDEFESFFPVRFSLSVLQFWVGWLIMARPPADEKGTWQSIVLSLPSFIVSGIMFRLSEPFSGWSFLAQWIFAAGVVWVMVSFWHLRHSFAILPQRRDIVRSGPYRWLRHPAYSGELLMATACASGVPYFAGWPWLLALIPLVVIRIRQEEKLLAHDLDFGHYRAQVRWRLVPGIW